MILSCQQVSLSFGTQTVLDKVSFNIEEHEKAAIIGANGAGKTTLLKIITGELEPDEGEVIISRGKTVGYLAQYQESSSNATVYDELMNVKKDILEMYENLRRLEREMKDASESDLPGIYAAYDRLSEAFERADGYALRSQITGILKGLGFEETDFDKQISSLSGGQKTRVALARLLLTEPDIILLDEPVNHLDMKAISWLESFLQSYSGTVITVAHDRYFLDSVAGKIIEIEGHRARTYMGNYTDYAAKKAKLREDALKAWINQRNEINHQEEVISKLRSFNREKSIKRARSREKMLEKMEVTDKPVQADSYMRLTLTADIRSGDDVLHAQELGKSFGSHRIFKDISFDIKRQEKVALIGDNGIGKSTVLKILNGLIPPDHGLVRFGSNVHVGYYDQEQQVLDMNKTIIDDISDTWPSLTLTRIRNVLAAFLFTGDDVFKNISDLSGGEKARVCLAKLMLSSANLLILDEPTNHLDISSREILENALKAYDGTILFVSHDRYFINRIAGRILELTPEGLFEYRGNYDYYIEKQQNPSVSGSSGTKTITGRSARSVSSPGREEYLRQKEITSRKRSLKNRLDKTVADIDAIDQRLLELDEMMNDESICSNAERLLEIDSEKKELEKKQDELMTVWEQLENDSENEE